MDKHNCLQPRSPFDPSALRHQSSRPSSPSNSRSPSFWDRGNGGASTLSSLYGSYGQRHTDTRVEYRSPLDLIRDDRDRGREGEGRRDVRRVGDRPESAPTSAALGHARTLSSLSAQSPVERDGIRKRDQSRDGYEEFPHRPQFRSAPGSASHPAGSGGTTGHGTSSAHAHPPPPPLSGQIPGSSKASPHSSAADSPRDPTGAGGGGAGDDGEDGKGPQRSRNGCLVCRKRKVKCDEVRPRCGKCAIKSRQCVWPDPEVKGNKKRRASIMLQTDTRPHQARRPNDFGAGEEGRSSRHPTPTGAVGKTEPSDAIFPPETSSSTSGLHTEINPLASLLGAAHASAMNDGHRFDHLGALGAIGAGGSGSASFVHDFIHGPSSGSSYAQSSPPLSAATQGFSALPSRLAQARRKGSSPAVADLRPTGRASLAQILDTHESLNAHIPYLAGSRSGLRRDAVEQDGRGQGQGHPPQLFGNSGGGHGGHNIKGQNGFDLGMMLGNGDSNGSQGVGRQAEMGMRSNSHLQSHNGVQRQNSLDQHPPSTIEPSSLHRAPMPTASHSLFDLDNLHGQAEDGGSAGFQQNDARVEPQADMATFGALSGVPAAAGNGTDGLAASSNMTNGIGPDPAFDPLDPDWFSLLFGNTDDLVTQPPPAFPPLHFQAPPLPPPTRFYVPPDFLPKHSLHDADDSHGGEFSRVLVRDDKRAEMMADPAFLAPYFPNLDERIVMRHYLKNTVNIIIAFQCPRKPWNPWVTIHAPLAFNHLPGVNPAADALRAAMLAVGGVHLRFTHDSNDQRGAWAIVRASKAKVLSLVRKSIDAQQANNTPMDKGDVEMILAALLSCTIASSLAADESWHELLTSVLSLVDRLGGAQALMREGRQAHDPLQMQGNLDGKQHAHMTSFRFLLEQLAIRDVFGCMTTELAPSMLNVAFSPWFFEAEGWSRGDDEWESIERMFGISRGMVDVIARACTLISQVRKNGITISEDLSAESGWGTHTKDFTLRLPQRVISRLDDARGKADTDDPLHRKKGRKPTVAISPHAIIIPTPPSTTSPSLIGQRTPGRGSSAAVGAGGGGGAGDKARAISPTTALLQADVLHAANGLIAELSVWDKSSNFTPFHPRTQYGNHTYRHAIKIRLLREVFEVPMDDKRVQDSVSAIVELTVELLAQYGRITWLTWPIVLAAFNMLPNDPQRQVALTLLNEFTYHACFDLTAARKMLCEYWEEEDVATTPGQVVKRQRVRPFLD